MISNPILRSLFYFAWTAGGALVTTMASVPSFESYHWQNYVVLFGGAIVTGLGGILGYRDSSASAALASAKSEISNLKSEIPGPPPPS